MKSPLGEAPLKVVETVDSTQEIARELLAKKKQYGGVLAYHQTAGKGRLGRTWHSEAGASLTASLIFRDYPDLKKPWLLGMLTAVACASACVCRLQWPNDLVLQGKKVGGVLVEIVDGGGLERVPIIGIGINLRNLSNLPEELTEAASLEELTGATWQPEELLQDICERMEYLPEPYEWAEVRTAWQLFDGTRGKQFQTDDGETGTAVGLGPNGELLLNVNGESRLVHAAFAWFNRDSDST
ncbi:MAG: biotin--[acetyl-CoA-carboxylase] ligase [Fimbriimonadaceae bacterium]